MNQCSHDLFYWGLCKLQDLPVQYVPEQHRHTQSDMRRIVSQGGKSCVHIHQLVYGLITDGPVHLDRPFAFGMKACEGRGRLEPNRHVESSIGYVPWPPVIECLYRSAGSLLAAKGSVFFTFSPTRADSIQSLDHLWSTPLPKQVANSAHNMFWIVCRRLLETTLFVL